MMNSQFQLFVRLKPLPMSLFVTSLFAMLLAISTAPTVFAEVVAKKDTRKKAPATKAAAVEEVKKISQKPAPQQPANEIIINNIQVQAQGGGGQAIPVRVIINGKAIVIPAKGKVAPNKVAPNKVVPNKKGKAVPKAGKKVIKIGKPLALPPFGGRPGVPGGVPLATPIIRVPIPMGRPTQRNLDNIKQQIEEKKTDRALEMLQSILDTSEDYFLDETQTTTLRRHVEGLISKLPKEIYKTYQLQYEPVAKNLLTQFTKSGNVAHLAEASRRFLNTESGEKATWLLARHLADRSESRAAIECFDRIKTISHTPDKHEPMLSIWTAMCWHRLGEAETGNKILKQYAGDHPTSSISSGDKKMAIFQDAKTLSPWVRNLIEVAVLEDVHPLQNWQHPAGAQSGSASAEEVLPIEDSQWTIHPIGKETAENKSIYKKMVGYLRQMNTTSRETSLIPAMQPVVVNDVAVIPTPGRLKAFNIRTGELLWESVHNNQAYQFLTENGEQGTAPSNSKVRIVMNGRIVPPNGAKPQSSLDQYLTQCGWRDFNAGTLSSDGQRVFKIQSKGILGASNRHTNSLIMRQGAFDHPLSPTSYNSLVAYDLVGGKLLWQIGGVRDGFNKPLAGTFFLGAPLSYKNKLYILGEFSREINLYQLDPATGAVDWSQPLAGTLLGIAGNTQLRQAGYSPILAQGLLLCPTGAGAIIAFDPISRSLVWEGLYLDKLPAGYTHNPRRRGFGGGIQRAQFNSNPNQIQNGWVEFQMLSIGGRIVLTSPHSDEFFCINVKDGKTLWKKPRENNLYIACSHNQKVILVNSYGATAFDLKSGKKVWSKTLTHSMVAAKGVRTGSRYHLPLQSGKVLTLSLEDGRELGRSPLADPNRVIGNLVAAQGVLVSAHLNGVFAFADTEKTISKNNQQLKATPQNADVLSKHGQLLLLQGDTQLALKTLRKSHAIRPTEKNSQLIISIIQEGIRADFEKYEQLAGELLKSLKNDNDRFQLLIDITNGLNQLNRKEEALVKLFEYIESSEKGDHKSKLYRFSATLSIQPSQWVRSQFATLLKSASPPVTEKFEQLLAESFKKAMAKEGAKALDNLLNHLPPGKTVLPIHQALLSRISFKEDPLQAERHILWLRKYGTEQDKASATARWLELIALHSQQKEFAPLLSELVTQFEKTDCGNGQTGLQVATDFVEKHSLLATTGTSKDIWGNINWKATSQPVARSTTYEQGVASKQSPNLMTKDLNYFIIQSNTWYARGSDGEKRWNFIHPRAAAVNANARRSIRTIQGVSQVRQLGHLALISDQSTLYAVNTLSPKAAENCDLTWSLANLPMTNTGRSTYRTFNGGFASSYSRYPRTSTLTMSNVGLELVCFRKGNHIVGVDPWTGKTLWERQYKSAMPYDLMVEDDLVVVKTDNPIPQTLQTNYNSTQFQRKGRRVIINGRVIQGNASTQIAQKKLSDLVTYFHSLDGSDISMESQVKIEKGTQLQYVSHIAPREKIAVSINPKTRKVIFSRIKIDGLQEALVWKKEVSSKLKMFRSPQGLQAPLCLLNTSTGQVQSLNWNTGTVSDLTKIKNISSVNLVHLWEDDKSMLVHLWEDDKSMFLMEYRPSKNRRDRAQPWIQTGSYYTPNNRAGISVNGSVYCFDKATKKEQWTKTILLQSFVANQFTQSPVLAFGATTYIYPVVQKGKRQSRSPKRGSQLLILNKKDGSTLYKKDYKITHNQRIYKYILRKNKKEVELRLLAVKVTLKPQSASSKKEPKKSLPPKGEKAVPPSTKPAPPTSKRNPPPIKPKAELKEPPKAIKKPAVKIKAIPIQAIPPQAIPVQPTLQPVE